MTDDRSNLDRDNDPATPDAGLTGSGEYTPAGEAQDSAGFTVDAVANAFDVAIHRVRAAVEGEFGLDADDARLDSHQAQHLAEVLLGDQPQDRQQAALMELGAFTPRRDHDWGAGEADPAEESDRLVRRGDQGDEERDFSQEYRDDAREDDGR